MRKSKTEFVLSLLYKLAQVHKLEIVNFNPLGRGDLVLEHQPVSNTPESPKQTQGG